MAGVVGRSSATLIAAMPLEGHWQKQNAPLRTLTGRERKAGLATLVVTAAALLAIVFATVGDSNPPTPMGCIRAEVAGVVGAETISGCGVEAEAKCAHAARYDSPRADGVVAECERQGIKF
jgi:hypothetical protein